MNDPKAPSEWLKIDGIDSLVELALNLHWSWNHAADELWEALDKDLWASTQNPWVILRTVSKEKIKSALGAPEFRKRLDNLLRQNRESYSADAWFQKTHRGAPLTSIAYFSMEFMLSEALPIYSGGLGNVAGDQMKAASDLGLPVSGVILADQIKSLDWKARKAEFAAQTPDAVIEDVLALVLPLFGEEG